MNSRESVASLASRAHRAHPRACRGVPVPVAGWLVAVFTLLGTRFAAARRRELIIRSCHELRGPITAARLAVELGGHVELSPSRLRALDIELARASLALDDLADVGARRRRRREASAPADVFSIRDLLEHSAEAWRAAAASRGIALRIGNCPDAMVRCHRIRLAQATGNLIANAIEHGGGEVELRARSDDQKVCVEVIDGGAGLPAPVSQLSRRARAGRGRRGRGLAIAVTIAREQGGRISAAPSERGARLVLELPVFGAAVPTASGGAGTPAGAG